MTTTFHVAKETGHFDFERMQSDFLTRKEEVGNAQARRELIAAIQTHVAGIMAEESVDAQREQVRLAANGAFARLHAANISEKELRS